ncbi:MAG: hypothetical protein WDA06_04330 [Phenylobacterium sp.]|jgi:Flp pilus assembly protein TadD
MDPEDQIETCPRDLLEQAMRQAGDDDAAGLAALESLLDRYPRDPGLHFLRGSILASLRRCEDAQAAMERAVEMAPGFALARFQLGFVQFTSGDAEAAQTAWAPLLTAPEDDPLRLFVEGLEALARDDFDTAVARLTEGVSRNLQNEPLNQNMRLLLQKLAETRAGGDTEGEPVSSAHLLLQQSATRRTMH